MASLKLGSKSDVFYLDGQTWFCSTGLPTDLIIEVGEMLFHLHKFPLSSRSNVLGNLIEQNSNEEGKKCVLQLHGIPGGAKTFLYAVKFCYGVRIELNAMNIVSLRCAAEYLQMTDDYGEGNLITQTEIFLNDIFGNWRDALKALESCEEVLPHAEGLHIVSRCINSLAMKACADPSLFSWPMSGCDDLQSQEGTVCWNGICTTAKLKPVGDDWWYEDVSSLRLHLFKRLIMAVELNGMKPERITGVLMQYAKKNLPLLGRQSSSESGNHAAPSVNSATSELDQRSLLEELVELLPYRKGVTPSRFLLRILRTAMVLQASPSCRENLERQIGSQLDQVALEDLLIPNMGYSVETLYDVDCVQRIIEHFMLLDRDDPASNCIVDEGQFMGGSHSLTPITMAANLIDSYLAEVAPDINLKLPKFQSLAALIPDYARPIDDGIYRAIDIFLKAHHWLTECEREQLCRLMNCQKLSLEASTHAAQNERLPLRVIVQVLFFEQQRLRTSVAGWFFVSDNLDNSQNLSGNLALARNGVHGHAGATENHVLAVDDMRERVSELEKECLGMKEELEKLEKTKGSWNILFKKFGLFSRSKSKFSDQKASKPRDSRESPSSAPLMSGRENQNVESVD